MSELVEPGGLGLCNLFLARPGFRPNDTERQFSQIAWCPVYTRKDVEQASAGLPLTLIADEAGAEYEKEHGPKDGWPPTGWYVRWSSGSEVFDLPVTKSQFEMRWLTFRRA